MIPITIVTVSASLFLTLAAHLFHVCLIFVLNVFCVLLWVRKTFFCQLEHQKQKVEM